MSENETISLPVGPQPDVTYPIRVLYCGNCSLPIEYCEYYPEYEKCKQWLERNMPSEFEKVLKLGDKDENEPGGEEEKKRQKRGGKALMKAKKKEDGPKQVCISRAPRGKKKSVTVVTGLSTFDIDLKVAAKFFGTKFACGSSVTGEDEIVIQGDVKDDLFDIIPEKWPEIDEDSIEDLGDQKR
ncbi:density-regulated protein homolog isoform X1 [Schistocerca americana]|uniref:density-regulated protein homolog n=1 Tax=Schistocerca cancellata TaxID=274614 RepID=UPI001F50281A|nr:density-regulated protein homolog isoform X1 [Schistocerca americana]XP_046995406.1 density-regulated protein homolog isoform X1 [Schistocerca americana]XP_046995415.1 density-regulated protein homolog isoform X1 [Schistocerca americana]XP_047120013.1 density-regulated protein homolog isoform X1 [Schistocerca piceifrons]XP_047120021.1 density-regulated protein homolog isoform X1 [Schistocerca piceifrons]XP_049780839.1 density-regulated protein homolog [Schistocerca cancellata]XP_049780840.